MVGLGLTQLLALVKIQSVLSMPDSQRIAEVHLTQMTSLVFFSPVTGMPDFLQSDTQKKCIEQRQGLNH